MMYILGKDMFLATFSSIKIWRLNCDIIASLWHYFFYCCIMKFYKFLKLIDI